MKYDALRRRRGWRRLALGLLVTAAFAVALAGPIAGTPLAVQVTEDQQGPNDEPGQKDLTRFTVDDASPLGTLLVSFNHDETGFSGANTGDGCFLFDTDGDGNANSALCVTFGQVPSVHLDTRLFTCGDDSSFKCTNPQTEVSPFASTCSVGVTATDPFAAGADHPSDTTSSCNIVLADVQPGTPVLTDVCSYPSAQPNSDPSDCIRHTAKPVAVKFQSFTANAASGSVVLRWRTASEVGTLGFNVYRGEAGKLVKLNRAMVASKATILGGTYRFVDHATATRGTRYLLQEVTLGGDRSWVASTRVASSR